MKQNRVRKTNTIFSHIQKFYIFLSVCVYGIKGEVQLGRKLREKEVETREGNGKTHFSFIYKYTHTYTYIHTHTMKAEKAPTRARKRVQRR